MSTNDWNGIDTALAAGDRALEQARTRRYEIRIGNERGYWVEATTAAGALELAREMAGHGEWGIAADRLAHTARIVASDDHRDQLATTATGEDIARDRMSGDWDENGTTSIHLPTDVAERLLAERGWTPLRYHGSTYWTSPNGGRPTATDEALQLALVAENA